MQLVIEQKDGARPKSRPIEIVERKGIGHPDTICDALAEEFSIALSRYYLHRFGRILHHNVDKVLLCGGNAEVKFGGGKIIQPIEIYFSGRATVKTDGETIPVAELLNAATTDWFKQHLHWLDSSREVKIHCLVKLGSEDLRDLFGPERSDENPLANDTSMVLDSLRLTISNHWF